MREKVRVRESVCVRERVRERVREKVRVRESVCVIERVRESEREREKDVGKWIYW